jgi:two-component system sensor histidine kinase DesK
VTNVLKHGAGRRARISLRREGGMWRYAIANDRDPAAPGTRASRGTGVAAMRDRIAALGGTVEVRADDEFVLTVAVPDGAGPDAVDGTGA